jgi:hypothetical protein
MSKPDPITGCVDCCWFVQRFEADEGGRCQASAPIPVNTIVAGIPTIVAAWPAVDRGDWCGNFMRREWVTVDLMMQG